MFNEEMIKTEESQVESKMKRSIVGDCFKEVLSKKPKRPITSKKEAEKDQV